MDLVLKLRELRHLRGISQVDAAKKSGLGVKTLSSFETGERIASMKLVQLQSLLRVYSVTEAEFFSTAIEHLLAPWEHEAVEEIDTLVCALRSLPSSARHVITDKLRLAIDLARDLAPVSARSRRHEEGGQQRAALLTV
jgi:transcriptional regulator with XRE-family HTH domain